MIELQIPFKFYLGNIEKKSLCRLTDGWGFQGLDLPGCRGRSLLNPLNYTSIF